MSKILQLKISLKEIEPKIWRRVLVEDSISFYELHEVIQKVMSWEDYHLFKFEFNNISITPPDAGFLEEDEKDPKKVKVNEFVNSEKQKFLYIYDFGDNWEHSIIVEKILKKNDSKEYPICIAGKRAGPPEDCGGVWGYEEILGILKDKKHLEYKEKIEWLGEDFDSEEFDIIDVNAFLLKNPRSYWVKK